MDQNTKEKCGTSQEDVKGQMSTDEYVGATGNDSADAGGENGLLETDDADMISQEGADAVEAFSESDKETEDGSFSENGKTRIPSNLCFIVDLFAVELWDSYYKKSKFHKLYNLKGGHREIFGVTQGGCMNRKKPGNYSVAKNALFLDVENPERSPPNNGRS